MKKLVVMLMLLCSITGWAQQKPKTWSITPKIGLNISKPTNNPPFYMAIIVYEQLAEDNRMHSHPFVSNTFYTIELSAVKSGLAVGVEAQYQFNSRLGLSLGAYYSQHGVRYDNLSLGDVVLSGKGQERIKLGVAKQLNVETSYITMPILLNYYVYKGFALKAGVQPAYCLTDKAQADLDIEQKEGYWIFTGAGAAEAHKVDVTVPVALSYDFPNGLMVDLRYYTGVVNLYTSGWGREKKPSSRTNVFQLTVGYKFGL